MCTDGRSRLCMPVLMAWIGDLEEQLLISCAGSFSCAVCQVMHETLDSMCCGEPRSADWIMHQLRTVRVSIGSPPAPSAADTWNFSEKVKDLKLGLSGTTEHPCWEGLPLGPERFLKGDILHGIHKFFWDHPIVWLKELIGEAELDVRFKVQPGIEDCVFDKGLSILSQVTGDEHREVQKTVLPAILGHSHVFPDVAHCVRALLDFSYIVQYPVLTETDLLNLQRCLDVFEKKQDIFLRIGARSKADFKIPKVHALSRFIRDVRASGSPMNNDTNTSKTLHKGQKKGYDLSNHRTDQFMAQILDYENLREKVQFRVTFMMTQGALALDAPYMVSSVLDYRMPMLSIVLIGP